MLRVLFTILVAIMCCVPASAVSAADGFWVGIECEELKQLQEKLHEAAILHEETGELADYLIEIPDGMLIHHNSNLYFVTLEMFMECE